jgi:hypothetical protein
LLQEMGMECPPEAMIDPALHLPLIKLMLGASFQGLPCIEGGMLVYWKGREQTSAIGEQQRIAYVEENVAAFCHASILLKDTNVGGS